MHYYPAFRWGRFGLTLVATLAAVPATAHADVLEIDATGEMRWVAGRGAVAPAASAPGDAVALEAGLAPGDGEIAVLPEGIVGDPARHAAAVPPTYVATVAELAARFDLSPALIEALVWQESRWNSAARSPVGARGLAQLMPGTARELGVNPDDPSANLEGGARYLRQQLDRFGGDLEKALAAYNAGPGRVIKAGGIPKIRETQIYVAAIMGRLSNHSRDPN